MAVYNSSVSIITYSTTLACNLCCFLVTLQIACQYTYFAIYLRRNSHIEMTSLYNLCVILFDFSFSSYYWGAFSIDFLRLNAFSMSALFVLNCYFTEH